jgi:hypothetical protein
MISSVIYGRDHAKISHILADDFHRKFAGLPLDFRRRGAGIPAAASSCIPKPGGFLMGLMGFTCPAGHTRDNAGTVANLTPHYPLWIVSPTSSREPRQLSLMAVCHVKGPYGANGRKKAPAGGAFVRLLRCNETFTGS